MEIETNRIYLRNFKQMDLEDLFAYSREEGVLEMSGKPHCETMADAQKLLDDWIMQTNRLAVVWKENGKVIGHVSIQPDSEEDREDTREIGCVLGSEYQHHGIMTEVLPAVMDYLYNHQIEYIWCNCFKNNIKSKGLIEKLGYVFQNEGKFYIGYLNQDVASYEYRLSKGEYDAGALKMQNIQERPSLKKTLSEETFRKYYYLKEELKDFCRENGISTAGDKLELTEHIAYFLRTGEIPAIVKKKGTVPVSEASKNSQNMVGKIKEETRIEPNFICSEKHRAFFREKIGKGFSFNVTFQKWLKENTGKTYQDAIEAYYQILEEKKTKKTTIDKQFEYNTYIRDFYEENKGRSLEEAIKCWKYKKSLPGHNKYEKEDLSVLSGELEK